MQFQETRTATSTIVHRKPMNTDEYLAYESQQP